MAGLLRTIYEIFPPHIRERLKRSLSAEGHASSWLDRLKARDHARGKKRLDLVAEALARNLTAAGVNSLRDATCLEFGAGYVPTEALVFHLLGAKSCVATDYNSIANLAQLADAAKGADRSRILRALTPLSDGVDVEQRLERILRAQAGEAREMMFSLVEYVAPFDMSVAPLPRNFDIIHSISVFEHLPPQSVDAILENLRRSLGHGGCMIHEIDLRDHLNLIGDPLAFLSRSDSYNPLLDFDVRGNRIRKPRWLEIFAALPETENRLLYQEDLPTESLPGDLVEEVRAIGAQDLLVGWIGMSSFSTRR